MSRPSAYIWHPQLHEARDEHLYFVRLYFDPVYPDISNDFLREKLVDLGASSAHVYELIGQYDLIFRVWLAGDVEQFVEDLRLPEMRRAEYMTVRRIHEHHVFTDAPCQELREPERLAPELIDEINGRLEQDAQCQSLSEYVGLGWIAPVNGSDGIKFFVSIAASLGTSSTIKFDQVLFEHVKRVLDDAGDLVQDRSIYAGSGFARLLLMGRILPERYYDFTAEVIGRLNDIYMRNLFNARTQTAFGVKSQPIVSRDVLPIPGRRRKPAGYRDRRSATEILAAGESQHVEVKASAFLDLDRWVATGTPDWSEIRPELVKAVCGLLNQREPSMSTLVLGALETTRYGAWLASRQEPLPEIGGFTVLGVEEDNPSGDWDKYRRRLGDALDSNITPAPADYLIVSALEAIESDGCVRQVLRLEIEATGRAFYVRGDEALWVRRGERVVPLRGRDRDRFVKEMEDGAA